MATRIPGEEKLYYANLNEDHITADWSLTSSHLLANVIIVAYLAFVLKIGPAFMENRQPFKLRKTLLAYNSIQVIFSLYLTIQLSLHYLDRPLIPMNCTSDNKEFNKAVLSSYWFYSIAKFTELLDTVFFTLRKKYSQVTFLHVYHHSIMMYGCFAYMNHHPTEHTMFLGLLNSIVHVFMYAYYTIAGLGPKYSKYIWWKKYITKIQLTQFCLMLTYLFFSYLLSNCPTPIGFTIFTQFCVMLCHMCYTYLQSNCPAPMDFTMFIGWNIFIFLILFLNFYIKNYLKSKKNVD